MENELPPRGAVSNVPHFECGVGPVPEIFHDQVDDLAQIGVLPNGRRQIIVVYLCELCFCFVCQFVLHGAEDGALSPCFGAFVCEAVFERQEPKAVCDVKETLHLVVRNAESSAVEFGYDDARHVEALEFVLVFYAHVCGLWASISGKDSDFCASSITRLRGNSL